MKTESVNIGTGAKPVKVAPKDYKRLRRNALAWLCKGGIPLSKVSPKMKVKTEELLKGRILARFLVQHIERFEREQKQRGQ